MGVRRGAGAAPALTGGRARPHFTGEAAPTPTGGGRCRVWPRETQDFWFTDYAAPLTGQATLTPSLRSDMCGKNGGVPEIVTLRPVSAGVNASAVQVVNGGTSSRSLDDVFTEY